MARNPYIKKAVSGILILMFALSITPKTLLHRLVANHKDSPSTYNEKGQHIETAGFHCDIDHLVVDIPFVAESNELVINPVKVFKPFIQPNYSFYYSDSRYFHTLRGPPAITV